VLRHPTPSPRAGEGCWQPRVPGQRGGQGSACAQLPRQAPRGVLSPAGPNHRQRKPCCPRSTVGSRGLAGAGASHERGGNSAFFARFPAKSASAGGCELSDSQEPDSAPRSCFPLEPRSLLPPGPEASPWFNGEQHLFSSAET